MIRWDEQIDIAIIGSGAAGLSAAIEACQAGCSAVVLEKMKVIGGNTRLADGALAGAGNWLQKERGIKDSPDLFYEDMIRAGLGLNHPRLVRRVTEQASDAIEWTRTRLGVPYMDRLDQFGGHCVPRTVTIQNYSGLTLVKKLAAEAEKTGADIRTQCLLTGFHTDADGRVLGIQIRTGHVLGDARSGELKHIRVRRGVILATGGFGNDVAFRMLQNPVLDERVGTTNHKAATAEAMIAALKLHAMPVHLSHIQTGPWSCADESGYGAGSRFASYGIFMTGILVDPSSGCRIVNEWGSRRERADAIFKTDHACVGITDAKGGAAEADTLQRCLKQGKIRAFDTVADLAAAYDMPVQALEAAVNGYNRMIKKGGKDEFGKDLSRKANPLDQAPYYAIRLWPKVHYTPGGIGIDEKARVIDLEGRPIPGLFAAGEVCGGIHGASRLGSCALTECVVFGRIAGRSAAAA